MASNTYSFQDVNAQIKGPGGNVPLGASAGVAEEGITISYTDDKGTMVMGADGAGMHSLHASKGGTATVRLLKTSSVNQLLNQMYAYQTTSSAYYGQNTITIRDPVRGDEIVCQGCGFRKHPDPVYAKDGGMMEWSFNCLAVDIKLGDGNPVSAINQGAT